MGGELLATRDQSGHAGRQAVREDAAAELGDFLRRLAIGAHRPAGGAKACVSTRWRPIRDDARGDSKTAEVV